MRHDQRNTDRGFTTAEGTAGHRIFEDERLEYPIGCKVPARELRMYTILFDQHRKEFGWQTMSDMYRDLLMDGYRVRTEKVKRPSREMKRMLRQVEEMEATRAGAAKHRDLDRVIERVDDDINVTLHAGDLAEVRSMLLKFRARTKEEDDAAIRDRREVEFDKRWGRLWDSLNRGVRLPAQDEEEK